MIIFIVDIDIYLLKYFNKMWKIAPHNFPMMMKTMKMVQNPKILILQ